MAALTPVLRKFVLHWGEMGGRWGVNRTVAQIHALLFLSERPLPAEEIASSLGVARSNVSTSLRELQGWGIVRVAHILGDRRDHFESLRDPWEMLRVILEQRKRREIDPTVGILRACAAEAAKAGPRDAAIRERLEALLRFFEEAAALYEELRRLPPSAARRLGRLAGKLRRWLGEGAA